MILRLSLWNGELLMIGHSLWYKSLDYPSWFSALYSRRNHFLEKIGKLFLFILSIWSFMTNCLWLWVGGNKELLIISMGFILGWHKCSQIRLWWWLDNNLYTVKNNWIVHFNKVNLICDVPNMSVLAPLKICETGTTDSHWSSLKRSAN